LESGTVATGVTMGNAVSTLTEAVGSAHNLFDIFGAVRRSFFQFRDASSGLEQWNAL